MLTFGINTRFIYFFLDVFILMCVIKWLRGKYEYWSISTTSLGNDINREVSFLVSLKTLSIMTHDVQSTTVPVILLQKFSRCDLT